MEGIPRSKNALHFLHLLSLNAVTNFIIGVSPASNPGYQFDYVFDWRILKYPQIGANSRQRQAGAKPALNAGPSGERVERPSVGQEIRDRFSGAVEAFTRRNTSGVRLHGDHSKHKASDDVPSSKEVQPDSKLFIPCFLATKIIYTWPPKILIILFICYI
ncbi:casein kinase 1-like protein 11 [Camellia sinensis]|uniref:casein kinase 1-like protein 11 n=1 Tax=Camellia sinensis TaxID=4442 RepID=UPI0010356313|nr:casein kinase 1-like protein 11 [Camellia sinensis]